MAYKRFIKKDGKRYGPYVYQSKKKDGKVVSQYLGKKVDELKKEEKGLKKFIMIGGVLLLLLLASQVFLIWASRSGVMAIFNSGYLDRNASTKGSSGISVYFSRWTSRSAGSFLRGVGLALG